MRRIGRCLPASWPLHTRPGLFLLDSLRVLLYSFLFGVAGYRQFVFPEGINDMVSAGFDRCIYIR
jgi:hypothetical protein